MNKVTYGFRKPVVHNGVQHLEPAMYHNSQGVEVRLADNFDTLAQLKAYREKNRFDEILWSQFVIVSITEEQIARGDEE